MNIKTAIFSITAALAGFSGIAAAQIPGNPFASFGLDFYGFFLPWIFTFAIVYGLLSKLGLFGGDNKRISGALAFVIAFFVTGVGGPTLASFFTGLFGGASMFLAGILVIILFAALLGIDPKKYSNLGAFAVVILIGVFLFLGSGSGFLQLNVVGPNVITAVFWLVIIAVAIYFVTKGGGDTGAPAEKK